MTSRDDQSRETQERIEYSGPEQLDRVLIHLREARERAAARGRNARGAGRAGAPAPAPAVEEKLAFGKEPEGAATSGTMQAPGPGEASATVQPAAPTPGSAAPPEQSPVPQHRMAAALGAAFQPAPQAVPQPAPPPGPHATHSHAATPASRHAAPVARETARATTGAPPSAAPPPGAASGAASAALPGDGPGEVAPRRPTSRLARAVAGETSAAPPPPVRPARTTEAHAAAPQPSLPSRRGELYQAVMGSTGAFRALAWFSFASNILMLAGPLFMLQVYDRVMTSGSIPTLVVLSLLTAAIYGVIGLLELVRSRVIVRIGVELDQRMSERVFAAALRRSLAQPGSSMHALRELDQLRQFVAGPGPLTFFDAPWTPVYLLVIFLAHWTLGVAATIGAVLLLIIAWASEMRGREPLAEAGKAGHKSLDLAESGQRNAEAIMANGMLGSYRARWQSANGEAIAWQVLAADRLSGLSSLSKSLRLLLQSLMLAIGAALAIYGQISAGAIIAATIIFGRALAPVEQAVAQWRSFVKARESFAKLEELLKAHPEPARRTSLPPPSGRLEARGLRVASPDGRATILANVAFLAEPGQVIAVIGPSASGKSTLVRALVGLWPTGGGEILLDGARLDQWNQDELGRHIGYLPQSVELFSGTVRENIARFEPTATDTEIVAAARAAHAHDMIMALPKGYDTELGAYGAYLSAGQRQRIGLARALFRDPTLVVLDEPNSNLDRSGDEALAAAIDGLRQRRRTVVLVSHRVQAIGKADLLLYLERGQQRAFGPRDDVLRFLQQGAQQQAPQQPTGPRGPDPATAGGKGAR